MSIIKLIFNNRRIILGVEYLILVSVLIRYRYENHNRYQYQYLDSDWVRRNYPTGIVTDSRVE